MRRLAVLLCCLLLAACSSTSGSSSSDSSSGGGRSSSSGSSGGVDVSTPALRQLKARAGIAPCRSGGTSQLPAVTLPCLGGGTPVDLRRLHGPLVINLWAQWCGPCRGELPYYQALHEKAAGRLHVVGIDYEDPQPAGALTLAEQAGITYPLLADPSGRLRGPLGIARGLPGIVLVAADGTVKSVQFRVFRSYAELRSLVQQQLGIRLPA